MKCLVAIEQVPQLALTITPIEAAEFKYSTQLYLKASSSPCLRCSRASIKSKNLELTDRMPQFSYVSFGVFRTSLDNQRRHST